MDDEHVEAGHEVEKAADFTLDVAVGEPDHGEDGSPENTQSQRDLGSRMRRSIVLNKGVHS